LTWQIDTPKSILPDPHMKCVVINGAVFICSMPILPSLRLRLASQRSSPIHTNRAQRDQGLSFPIEKERKLATHAIIMFSSMEQYSNPVHLFNANQSIVSTEEEITLFITDSQEESSDRSRIISFDPGAIVSIGVRIETGWRLVQDWAIARYQSALTEQPDSAPILTLSIVNSRMGKYSKLHELDHQSHVD
jgi:hypothetical protein